VWVDGSGLSRYNLFTPDAFVEILDSMRTGFGMERVKGVFPTGDSGTLKNYYVSDNGRIYAKTGSMSGVLALSGFLYGRNNRLMIFSVLVNNYNGTGANGRRAIERFIKKLLQ
jgi:D-alanyl-D-alanine carboxypeptidase/D-alanyl-D-alanine-endopeptidase (penicillin-binding protein 4)